MNRYADLSAILAASQMGYDPYAHAPQAVYGAGTEIYGAGLEIYGYSPTPHPLYGAAAYGAAAYGADPSRASYPAWMHNRMHGAHAGGAIQPRGVEVDTRVGNNVRRFPLGFTSVTAVNAGTSASVTAQPQVPYRPEKFVVPSDIAGSFDITNILVGKDSQFVVPNPIPARAFTETAVDNLLSFHGVAISQIITIQVTNTGGANLIFKGYMAGTAVE